MDLRAVVNDRVEWREWGRIPERVFHFPIRVTCNTGGDVLELIKRSHLVSTTPPLSSPTPRSHAMANVPSSPSKLQLLEEGWNYPPPFQTPEAIHKVIATCRLLVTCKWSVGDDNALTTLRTMYSNGHYYGGRLELYFFLYEAAIHKTLW